MEERRAGVTPSDLREMRRIFDDHTPSPILRKAHAFHWNNTSKKWELYRVPNIEDGDRIAEYDGSVWVED